jgi:hypothetical protein
MSSSAQLRFCDPRLSVGLMAEAAVLWTWLVRVELGSLMAHVRPGAVVANAVDGGVGVADGMERVGERGVAPIIHGFREQKDRTPIGSGLVAEHTDGEGDGVENRCMLITRLEDVERMVDEVEVGRETVEQDG